MSLDPVSVFTATTAAASVVIKKINKAVNDLNEDYFRDGDRICIITLTNDVYVVDTVETTCCGCWKEMQRNGYISVDLGIHQNREELLINASQVKEMFLGKKHHN